MKDPKQTARILKVLAVDTRLRIIQLLRQRPLCVNALASRLEVTQGAVSQHLRIMRDAGLVIDEKRGYFVHYRLNDKTMTAWRDEITKLLTPPCDPENSKRGAHKCAAAKTKKCKAAAKKKT